MTAIRRTWVADDPDDEDNQRFVPPEPDPKPAPEPRPQPRLDDFADRLEDRTSRDIIDEQRRMDARQKVIDIDRLMAEKQGLPTGQGTLDPYADPKGVMATRQAQLRPYLDRYADYRDIAAMWGLSMNGYRFPKDRSDEEIERFLEDMREDLQKRIKRKKMYGW